MDFLIPFLLLSIPLQISKFFSIPEIQAVVPFPDLAAPQIYLYEVLIIVICIFSFIQKKLSFRIPYPLLLIVVLNSAISTHPLISIVKWFKLILLIYLFRIIVKVPAQKLYLFISISVVFLLFTSIFQIYLGKSIGFPFNFLGERPISIYMSQIAKEELPLIGQVIRPYATLPHPNILGMFFAISSLVFVQNTRRFKLQLLMSAVGTMLSFSLNAAMALFISLISTIKPRFKFLLMVTVVLSIIGYSQIFTSTHPSMQERKLQYLELSSEWSTNAILGLGLGTSTLEKDTSNINLIHNSLLLLYKEIGLVGVVYLLYLVLNYHKNINPQLLAIVIMSSQFDHFYITSYQLIAYTLVVAVLIYKLKYNNDG